MTLVHSPKTAHTHRDADGAVLVSEQQIAAAYLAGFMSSGEGWNGEHPFEGYADDHPELKPVRECAAGYARRFVRMTRTAAETGSVGTSEASAPNPQPKATGGAS